MKVGMLDWKGERSRMPFERGGRSDKYGNLYEMRYTIYYILKVIEEQIVSVELESIGDDETGIDLWIENKDGTMEGHQCKARNANKEFWEISSLKSRGIIKNWKKHLERKSTNIVVLGSPLSCQNLLDLINRANNTNGNPRDFLDFQINTSSIKKDFQRYCQALELNEENEKDLIKIIDYLQRTKYNQIPDYMLEELIEDKIRYLFIGDEKVIYNKFESLILDGNIFATKITLNYLYRFLDENNIESRNLAKDTRIKPRANELNRQFEKNFKPINGNLIYRDEFDECISKIEKQKSIIIDGKAGIGKSGCTNLIIKYCKDNNIPYLAIKLDEKLPSISSEKWGQNLGFPTSIIHSIDSISKDRQAVIILDQLDVLRWTQAHSRGSLSVCEEIIRELLTRNKERKNKISLIFVCRTYDVENDSGIRNILEVKVDDENLFERIKVHELKEEIVRNIVGVDYYKFPLKTKRILTIPSNLYIWEQLDSEKKNNKFTTTYELIENWWEQVQEKCRINDISRENIIKTINKLVLGLEKSGKNYISTRRLNIAKEYKDYLLSSEIINISDNKLCFAHQSILDYFNVKNMFERLEEENIIDIIGEREKQGLERRYQIQMLLQFVQEDDLDELIYFGKEMLDSDKLRFYIKYIFLEVLGQTEYINTKTREFILEYLKKDEYKEHIINTVIKGHELFIDLLIDEGVFDKWMKTEDKKNIFYLMNMINFNAKQLNFIKKYSFINEEDDLNLFNLFNHNISKEKEDVFKLRIEFYNRYPQLLRNYIDLDELFIADELRGVEIVRCLINKNESLENIYNRNIDYNGKFEIHRNEDKVITKLLEIIPKVKEKCDLEYSWIGDKQYLNSYLERVCIDIIKKANTSLIEKNPEDFIKIYIKYMGEGYILFNELILDGLEKLPIKYSDFVIKYLSENINNNIIDETSGKNKLDLVNKVLQKHTGTCDLQLYKKLERNIIKYISPEAKFRCQYKVNYNKKGNEKVYISFWGDLQFELLNAISEERLSIEARNLLRVLERKFRNGSTMYIKDSSEHGSVISPITGKKLSNKQWINILLNKNVGRRNITHWNAEDNVFIESSIEEYSREFSNVISKEPNRFIKLIMNLKEDIDYRYINAVFNGLSMMSAFKEIDKVDLERLIIKYYDNLDNIGLSNICRIISKANIHTDEIIEIIKKIYEKSKLEIEYKDINSYNNEDELMELITKSVNSLIGNIAGVLENILWRSKDRFSEFNSIIIELINDSRKYIRLCGLKVLYSTYNIDKRWTCEKVINLVKRDYIFAGTKEGEEILFRAYNNFPEYREIILKSFLKCYNSEESKIQRISAQNLAELYLKYNEFEKEIYDVTNISENQLLGILDMLGVYFRKGLEKERVKYTLIRLIENHMENNLEMDSIINYMIPKNIINMKDDKELFLRILKYKGNKKYFRVVIRYIEKNTTDVILFREMILSLIDGILKDKDEVKELYYGDENKVIILLLRVYDELKEFGDTCLLNKCLDNFDELYRIGFGNTRELSELITNH
ncbi:hypothetical protein [Clostridium baratii]|uniref:hypothetical protein n=1 Tax=Clostridium baratii TaxID=1561 RepID=UPI0030D07260